MNVKEKAKAYDEALETARQEYNTTENVERKQWLEELFPELKESENEKIRQKFIKLVKMSSEVGGFALHKWEADEMLAWLEKQGEKKPAWSEETDDDAWMNDIISKVENNLQLNKAEIDWLKSIKQRIGG